MALFGKVLPAGLGEFLDGRYNGIGPEGAVELLCSAVAVAAIAFQALVVYFLRHDLLELRVEAELVVGVVVQDGAERVRRRGRSHVLPAAARQGRYGRGVPGLKVGGRGGAARRIAGNVIRAACCIPLLVAAHGYRRRDVQLPC